MSKLYYDHLINLKKIEEMINKSAMSSDEKEELWKIVDEVIHHSVMGCVLDNLQAEHHEEFLKKFSEAPYDEKIIEYLEEKSGTKISDRIRETVRNLENEILKEIQTKK